MQILYFSWLRNHVGTAQEQVEKPDHVQTIHDLIAHLREKGDNYQLAFQNIDMIKIAVNQEFADHDHKITAHDEIAFFPPITGG